MTADDATRNICACCVCERETLLEHYMALEQMFAHVGIPQSIYTDAFTMFGQICRAFGMLYLIAPTPQAKGKIECYMRTFQHRLAIVFASQGVNSMTEANAVAFEHYRHWNATHYHRELGCTPLEARSRLVEEGKSLVKPPPNFKVVRLFLSLRERRRVEMGKRIEFDGRWWTIARTSRKYVTIAVRPYDREFYVLEEDLNPIMMTISPILGKFSY